MKYSVVFLLFVGLCVVATFANEEPSVEDVGTECGENGAPVSLKNLFYSYSKIINYY